MEKTETRGGKRPRSGRKPSNHETKTVSFRVRVEHAEKVKDYVKSYIKMLIKNDDKKTK